MSSSTRRPSSAGASSAPTGSSKRASKKRRYMDIVRRCRNPFCGAVLPNRRQRYCDGNRLCQLRRGLVAHCAWPNGEEASEEEDVAADGGAGEAEQVAQSSGKAVVAGQSTVAPSPSPPGAATKAAGKEAAKEKKASESGEKRQRSGLLGGIEKLKGSSKKARLLQVLQRHSMGEAASPSASGAVATAASATASGADSASALSKSIPTPSNTSAPTPPVSQPPTPIAATTAQQVKAASIDVVPLGVGSRGGGGGRYVQSGNRAVSSGDSTPKIVRPRNFGRFASSDGALSSSLAPSPVPSPHATSSATTSATSEAGSAVPPASFSSQAPSPSRTPARASSFSSIPATTTNRSRDPRVRSSAVSDAAGSAANDSTASGVKRISAAAYLSNRNKDLPNEQPSSSSGSSAPQNGAPETLFSVRIPGDRLERSASSQSASSVVAPSNGMPTTSAPRTLQRAQSDSTASVYTRESTSTKKNDSFRTSRSDHQPSSEEKLHNYQYESARSRDYRNGSSNRHQDGYNESYDRSQSAMYSWPNEIYGRGSAQDRPPLSHVSTAGNNSSWRADPEPFVRPKPIPTISRAERLFETMLRPKFSHEDPFAKLFIQRMVSFLPHALGAVRNKTTKPRKLKFYLDYAERVHKYCGKKVQVSVGSDTGRVLVDGREWVSVKGSSTMAMYHDILEKLLTESEMWRDVIDTLNYVHAAETRNRQGGAIGGVSFLKLWSSLKREEVNSSKGFDFQSSFTAGRDKYHWVFAVNNVEIGSGTGFEKLDAFKNATSSAFSFLSKIEMLPDKDKYAVANIGRDIDVSRESNSNRQAERRSSAQSTSRSSSQTTSTQPPAPVVRRKAARTPSSAAPDSRSAVPPIEVGNSKETIDERSTAASSAQPPVNVPRDASSGNSGANTSNDGDERKGSKPSSETGELNASVNPGVRSEPSDSHVSDDSMEISDEDAKPTQTQPRKDDKIPEGQSRTVPSGNSITSLPGSSLTTRSESTQPATDTNVKSTARPSLESSSVSIHTSKPTSQAAVSAPRSEGPSCRFCRDMQASKPGSQCFRCKSKSGSSNQSTTSSEPQHESNSTVKASSSIQTAPSSNRNVDALQSFLRQTPSTVLPSSAKSKDVASDAGVTNTQRVDVRSTLDRLQNGLQSDR